MEGVSGSTTRIQFEGCGLPAIATNLPERETEVSESDFIQNAYALQMLKNDDRERGPLRLSYGEHYSSFRFVDLRLPHFSYSLTHSQAFEGKLLPCKVIRDRSISPPSMPPFSKLTEFPNHRLNTQRATSVTNSRVSRLTATSNASLDLLQTPLLRKPSRVRRSALPHAP